MHGISRKALHSVLVIAAALATVGLTVDNGATPSAFRVEAVAAATATPSGAPADPPADPGADPELDADRAPAAPRVALQAGHWLAHEAPDELARIRSNGTRGGGVHEWEVTLRIAELTAERLRDSGFDVEILPATIPPGYSTDLFISIHADGIDNATATGFSAGASRRDRTGHGDRFVGILAETYREATGLRYRPNVTRRMSSYYAFNNRRYRHSLDPATVGVVVETGFLTTAADRRIIVDQPERSAEGIAQAVMRYFDVSPVPPVPAVVAR